ncbi:MAG TPA: hypothetical protein VGH15_07485 [Caulobacteraceae bacterium]|jgi:hypothetical protein
MRNLSILLIAGAGALAAAAAVAATSAPGAHMLTIRFPNGAVERFSYVGDTPPRVSLDSRPVPFAAADVSPLFALGPIGADPFAELDRVAAEMDREMAGMRQAMSLAGPGGLQTTGLGSLPAGGESYSMVSTFSGGHACTRSVQVTSQGPGKTPKVVSQTSGDCASAPTRQPQAAPSVAPSEPRTPV